MKTLSIKDYIYPSRIFKLLKKNILDISNNKRYKAIISELESDGKLKDIGFSKTKSDLFYGVNLNPELLMYTEDSQESVELKFVSDASRKYTKFLENEGILDSITADYERVKTDDFYGYIVKISYNSKFNKNHFIYSISYIAAIVALIISSIAIII